MQAPGFCDIDQKQMQEFISEIRREVNVKEMLDNEERKEEGKQESEAYGN